MKPVTKATKKVLDVLTEGMKEVGDHRKIENGAYMPLTIEVIDTYGRDEGLQFSFCHYGQQNGDLMRDPEVCLIRTACGDWYPYYFRNDYLGKEDWAVEFDPYDGTVQSYWKALQKSIADFLTIWARNLKEQGFLKVVA